MMTFLHHGLHHFLDQLHLGLDILGGKRGNLFGFDIGQFLALNHCALS
jgi:hypothetical protein